MKSFQLTFEAIGTHWVIDCYEVKGKISETELFEKVKKRIELFDVTYSRFRKDSLVWSISEKAGKYKFPPDSEELFTFYDQLYKITDGKFTLLIGNTLDEAGYDSSYSLKPRQIHKVPEPSSIYSFDYPTLTVKKPYILDFGGLGKGYLIDILSQVLEENGTVSYCIDGGGDIFYKTREGKPLNVGLENPMDTNQVIGVAKINNQSICASSGNRRKWNKFHHIIDPDSLSSPESVLSTWVVAANTITADAMATCLFLVSPQKLLKYFEFEYLVLYPNFTIDKSENFPAEIFIK